MHGVRVRHRLAPSDWLAPKTLDKSGVLIGPQARFSQMFVHAMEFLQYLCAYILFRPGTSMSADPLPLHTIVCTHAGRGAALDD